MANKSWPSHSLVSACCGKILSVWDPLEETPGFVQTFTYDDRELHAVCWNPNNKVLAFGGESGKICLYSNDSVLGALPPRSADDGKPLSPVQGIAFVGDKKYVVSGSKDGSVVLWDLRSQVPSRIISDFKSCAVTGLVTSNDGQYLASTSSMGDLMVYRLPDMSKLGKYYSPSRESKLCAAFSNGLSDLLVASGDGKGNLYIWNAMGRMVKVTEKLHKAGLSGVAFSPASPLVVYSAGMDGKFKAFDTRSGRNVSHNTNSQLTCMALKDDGGYVALGTADSKIKIYDIRNMARPVTETLANEWERPVPVTAVMWQRSAFEEYGEPGNADPVLDAEQDIHAQDRIPDPNTDYTEEEEEEGTPRHLQTGLPATTNPLNWPFSPVRQSSTIEGTMEPEPVTPTSQDDPAPSVGVNSENPFTPVSGSRGPAPSPRSVSQQLPKWSPWGGSLASSRRRETSKHEEPPVTPNYTNDVEMGGDESPPPSASGLADYDRNDRLASAQSSGWINRRGSRQQLAEQQPTPRPQIQQENDGIMAIPSTSDLVVKEVVTNAVPVPADHPNCKDQIAILREDMRNMHIDLIKQLHYQEENFMKITAELFRRVEQVSDEVEELKQMILEKDGYEYL